MSKIVIIGAGSMGTAFAYPCVDNLNEVRDNWGVLFDWPLF